MLLKLEIDGFKNLLGVVAEFGPFTCIAGPNGSGKSNLFDAVEFLSLLADHPLMEAAQRLRGTGGRAGDPREMFWTDGVEHADRMCLAAEFTVPHRVEDDFGRSVEATITLLRYELELGYEPAAGLNRMGRLVLMKEQLAHINLGDASRHMRFAHSAREFRHAIVKGRRSGTAFISTEHAADGQLVVQVHQDGGSRGRPSPSPATTAPRTIVSTVTTSSDPTILAARREFQSWRRLALEPAAMRSPDDFAADPHVAPSGARLAATLYRLASTAAVSGARTEADVYAEIASRAARLVAVHNVRVDRDNKRELLTLEIRERFGEFLPARSLSDGTLRFLALCIIDSDDESRGVVCMEEPENGIHPAKIGAMVELVRGLALDPFSAPGAENPMRQVLVNTHSPPFVQLQHKEDLLFAQTAMVRSAGGRAVPSLRLRPLRHTWRCSATEPGVGLSDVLAYLTAPPGAQIRLPTLDPLA